MRITTSPRLPTSPRVNRLAQVAQRLLDVWQTRHPDAEAAWFGGVVHSQAGAIDAGDYGNPIDHESDRQPDFIKADDEGWQRLT